MSQGEERLPRTIWSAWFQGLDGAPYVVRKCLESWASRNPGWRVVTLDDTTLPAYSSLDFSAGHLAGLSLQHRSDLIRLELLAKHGGVWADATCFCVQPLDDWLLPRMGSGLFAFHRPVHDRELSNWFLAASPGNPLVEQLYRLMLAYWGDHAWRSEERRHLVRLLTRALRASRRTRAWWFTPPLRNWLAVGPYYAFHYGFEKLLHDDQECARIWAETAKLSAGPPHRLYRAGLLSPVSEELRSEIDRREVPVYKATWHLGGQPIPPDSVLAYLLEMART